jgi:hypothetical protein
VAALETVTEYIGAARTLLQDTVVPYRYADAELLLALSFAMLTARRLRPDMFIGRADAVPSYAANDSTVVVFDQQYRVAALYFVVGHAQLRDEEDTQDARAAGLLNKFSSILLALQ